MRIYRGKIELTVEEILGGLMKGGLIEVEPGSQEEARKDLESVLIEYSRMAREINDKAKDIAQKRGLDYSAIGRLRRGMAKEHNFGLDDDALDYIVQQMIEIMFSSHHVEEVFGEDHELNRAIAPILRKNMSIDEELDREVREKIKHLEDAEGTVNWEIEYQQRKEELERLKKLK
jgi:uncharacterized protein